MNSTFLSNGKVSPSDVANGDGAAGLVIHAQWRREMFAILRTNVEDVAATWITGEVDQVNDAISVDGCLGLDAAVGHSQ
jgi:hypothetical protein